jgi:hypothetical protein
MRDEFELLDPENAEAFLQRFSPTARRKGEALIRGGKALEVSVDEPGVAYAVMVEDGELEEVFLEYDQAKGWDGSCTCEAAVPCAHIFAGMRAVLTEHTSAVVRNLSASGPAAAAWAAERNRSKAGAEDNELARRLLVALGRRLTNDEKIFLKRVNTVWKRSCQTRHITHWDFDEMGLRLGGYGWNAVEIWPAFPKNEYEFWLYVANTALEGGARIPDFMDAITDLTGIHDKLVRWRRAKEVEKWKHTLGSIPVLPLAQPGTAPREIDLRLMVGEKNAHLEWRRPGRDQFETMKAGHLGQVESEREEGATEFMGDAGLLWDLFSPRLLYGSNQLAYHEMDSTRVLGRILRAPLLESRVVGEDGLPLSRPSEPLRWDMIPAADAEDDYRLRLVQADGSPPPPVRCTLPGNPTLYVTARAIFTGPSPQRHLLEERGETRIPAAAIEQPSGVAFLQSLRLELPQRIREQIQTLPFEITIHAELKPIYEGSKTEEMKLTVTASAPDGCREVWTGHQWTAVKPAPGSKKPKPQAGITMYDWAQLAPIPALLDPLDPKPSSFGAYLTVRVTKRFPELFIPWLKSVPPHIVLQLEGDLKSFLSADIAGQVSLDATEAGIDWFDLRVVLNVSDATLTPEEIKLLLNAKGNYVRLAGKGWRRLQFDLSEDENERLARLGISTRELSAEPQRLHALQLADDAAKKFLPEAQVHQIQRRASEIKARVAPDLPAGITAQLRPYQLEGFHFLAYLSTNRFGGILADDMGLGKTLQTLAWLLWLREQKPAGDGHGANPLPSLVVCPKSVMDNWHAEAARFAPGLRVKSWPASEIETFRDRLAEADLHVLNYSQLRILGESLLPTRWQAVILDEGQYIKNPNSQTAQVARALHPEHRLILSGTPIENRLLDLWSLMSFAMPGVLSSRAQFARLYDAKGDPFARRRLSSRVRPFLLRRTKTQVAKDLPDRIEEDLYCEIEGEQKALYRAELKRAQQLLLRVQTQKELAEHQFHFLTSLLRLRQICCHPRLISGESEAPSAKVEALLEQLEPIIEEGNKVLIFSQFVSLLDLLRPVLSARNWPVFYLTGGTEDRGELVSEFQALEGPAVFLISLKAGGFGLNLTAASYVVLFDPWWNPAVENQAIDRTHRIGQANKVIAYRLLIKDSIEEKIRTLQKQKSALAGDVLGEERFAQSLTLSDLQFLFSE